MSREDEGLAGLDREVATLLGRSERLLAQARSDDALLALRDQLLDWQFGSRQLITAIEERLGAFDGDDSPRALAAEAESLIEQIEGLQDGWETRLELLLTMGFNDEQLGDFFREAQATEAGRARLGEVFSGIVADMDQTGEFLDYARRYLLSLVVPPPAPAGSRRPPGGPGQGQRPGGGRPRPPRR